MEILKFCLYHVLLLMSLAIQNDVLYMKMNDKGLFFDASNVFLS